MTQCILVDVNKTSIIVCLADYTIPTVCKHPFYTKECGESEAFIQNFYFSRKYFGYKQMVGTADVHVHHFATKLAWLILHIKWKIDCNILLSWASDFGVLFSPYMFPWWFIWKGGQRRGVLYIFGAIWPLGRSPCSQKKMQKLSRTYLRF